MRNLDCIHSFKDKIDNTIDNIVDKNEYCELWKINNLDSKGPVIIYLQGGRQKSRGVMKKLEIDREGGHCFCGWSSRGGSWFFLNLHSR